MTFIVAAFAAFLATFNETFLNVALKPMENALNTDASIMTWVVTAYMLGAAIMVPISAFLYKKISTKILFLVIVGFFIVGSLVGALAQNFLMVLIARIIQAIGSGMLIPVSMNIVLEIAPRERLGLYMGTMGAMTTLGPSLSLIVAGLLLKTGDFHNLFWVFGGLCVILFVLSIFFIGNISKLTKPKLDILSVIYISVALIGILFAISFVFQIWWVAIIVLFVGILALSLFVLRQKKLEMPLINLKPIKNKAFSISVIINMIGLVVVFAFNVILPSLLISKGAEPLIASLTLFPAVFLTCIIAPIAGKIYDKFGAKWLLIIGFLLMAIFGVLIGYLFESSSFVVIGALYVPVIVGSAFIIGPIQSYGLSSLKPDENPHGVTIFSTGFQIAGCIGAALFPAIFYAIMPNLQDSALLITAIAIACVCLIGFILSLILIHLKSKEKAKYEKVEPVDAISSVMKKNVFTIFKDASIIDALMMMKAKKISGMPVIDDNNNLVGYLSDGDIMRYFAKNHVAFKFAYAFAVSDENDNLFQTKLSELAYMKVCDIASSDPFFVRRNTDFNEICRVLATTHKKKVPVLNEENKIVGIIDRSEVTDYIIEKCVEKLNK